MTNVVRAVAPLASTDRPAASQEDSSAAIAHVPALDGIRGLAILLVLCLHFGVAADFPSRSQMALGRWLDRLFYTGWSGVDLFFVLSGFLITSILLKSRQQPAYYRRFYARRSLRILPLHFTALVLLLVILPRLFPTLMAPLLGDALTHQAWYWTLTLNLAMAFGVVGDGSALAHYWTLAIEERSYLCWPAVVKVLSGRALVRACWFVIGGALLLRIVWMALGLDWTGAYRFTLTRVDGFAFGGLIALLLRDPRSRATIHRLAPIGLLLSLAIVAAIFFGVPRFYPNEWVVITLGHSILAVMFACLIVIGLRPSPPHWMRTDMARALGRYSYGIYVWHWPLQRFMVSRYAGLDAATPTVGLIEAAAFLLIGMTGSVVLAWISYRVIERPFLRLKDRFAY